MKKIASAIALLPAGVWIVLYLWDPGATLLPVLALIWGVPALLGWRYPGGAGCLLLGVAGLGLLTAGVAWGFTEDWWFTLIPLVLFFALPLVSALFLFLAMRRER
jgi:hypothetical protein